MSTPEAPTTQHAAAEPCAACGAPLAGDQRYCLHCGEARAGARRPMPAALRGSIHGSAGDAVVPASRPVPSLAATLAGVACLLLAMGIGVLIARGGGEPAAQAPITVAAAPAAPATAATFTGDWPQRAADGWTIALAQLPKAATTPAAVAQAKAAAASKGAPAVGALDADAYASLTAGSYVVYSGVFDTERAATAARAPLAAAFPNAVVVRVGAAAAAAGTGAASKGTSSTPAGAAGGSSSTKKSSSATKSTSGAADTTKEFEKSKKAPKTVGTGGKPPPKDNKAPAGGGSFQEIG